eukprot:Seg1580.6 transcript_id=Seg1580.6/GoldUCD/mRNA.D3Y31 product="Plexin domain-containing protein 2" protein_id=Seg1580.6/GoldUCD/D3Y31
MPFLPSILLFWIGLGLGLADDEITSRYKHVDENDFDGRVIQVAEVKYVERGGLKSGENSRSSRSLRYERDISTVTNKTSALNSTKTTISPLTTPKNNTVNEDDHSYYTSKFIANADFKDLKKLYDANDTYVTLKLLKTNKKTSNAILYTVTKIKFNFPFYGHLVKRVVITSAGFLHIGPIIHNFAHDVHYVAPLMGNFSFTTSEPINVYIYDDGETFTAQWESVYEGGKNNSDPFTFQVSLFKNGSIIFAYKTIPYSLSKFVSKTFLPKVGLADGFVKRYYMKIGDKIYGPLRVIYKYHTVALKQDKVRSNTAYFLTAVANCVQAKSCNACFSEEVAKNFKCKWCDKLQQCSDTFDWYRQLWDASNCPKTAVNSSSKCNIPRTTPTSETTTATAKQGGKGKVAAKRGKKKQKPVAGIIVGVLLVLIIAIIAGVLLYGYRNPQSKVGMFMIQNRPSVVFRRV